MKNLLLYPFNRELSPLARFRDLLVDFEDIIAVAPSGFGFSGKDASVCDGGEGIGIPMEHDFSAALEKCEAVLFDETTKTLPVEDYIHKIQAAVNADKNVFVTRRLKNLLEDKNQLPRSFPNLTYLDFVSENIILNDENRLLEIPAPCVVVLGSGERSNKFEVQLSIGRAFRQAGYTVSQFGTKEYSSLFGFESLPSFLFDEIPVREKILDLNHFLYERTKRDQSDVLILGVPGGIMQVNPFNFEEYGEFAFVVGSAVKADVGVLSLYCAQYPGPIMDKLLNICLYRDNVPVKFVNMSGNDMTISHEDLECRYITVPSDFINREIIPKVGFPAEDIFTVLNSESSKVLGDQVVRFLEKNW